MLAQANHTTQLTQTLVQARLKVQCAVLHLVQFANWCFTCDAIDAT